jgi:hypothetical protein
MRRRVVIVEVLGRRGRYVHHALNAAEFVVWDCAHQRLDLVHAEEADVWIRRPGTP